MRAGELTDEKLPNCARYWLGISSLLGHPVFDAKGRIRASEHKNEQGRPERVLRQAARPPSGLGILSQT